MKEWVAVGAGQHRWEALTREALAFVGGTLNETRARHELTVRLPGRRPD